MTTFLIFTGKPPYCELCHSPCYYNWQQYIEQEKLDIQVLNQNVTDMFNKFGGLSYHEIAHQLRILNANLTFSAKMFDGARYNTMDKEHNFLQV